MDYAKITSNGKVLGRDGLEISSKDYLKPGDHPKAHIPLDELKNWKQWDKP